MIIQWERVGKASERVEKAVTDDNDDNNEICHLLSSQPSTMVAANNIGEHMTHQKQRLYV